MADFKPENFRTSSSSIDDFLNSKPVQSPRIAANGRIRVSSIREIGSIGFSFVAKDKLVRISQQDFWQLGEDESGHYIERLVSDEEGPVKG